MSDEDGDGVYEAEILYGYKNLIFCRMNPAGENGWTQDTQLWNKTKDLALSESGNCYRIAADTWTEDDNSLPGVWYNYPCVHDFRDADCTTAKTCNICGHTVGDPLGHTWGEWILTKYPEGTSKGENTHTCSVCGKEETTTLIKDYYVDGYDVYLIPNANWKTDKARFAAYFFENGKSETWISLKDTNGDGIYEGKAPAGYTNVIFCRMNPSAAANNWNNKWNQTADLKFTANQLYTVKENTWDKGGGTWSPVEHQHVWILATCTTAKTCYTCGYTSGAPLGHDEVHHDGKAATCTEAGYEAYVTCTRCDYTTYKDIAAHGHEWDGGKVTTPATCTTDGVKTYTCKHDGSHTKTETIKSEGHKYAHVVTAPTCEADGYTTHTCSVCGESYVDTYVDATGHKEETIPGKAATCTGTGLTEGKKCSVCDKVLVAQEAISAKGHTDGSWIVDKEATCTENGSKHQICSVCGVTIKTETISSKGHTDEVVPGKTATCTEDGLTEGKKCSVCGVTTLAQETIPAKGHTDGSWTVDKEATCTENGSKHQVCSVCGETIKTEIINTIPHSYTSNVTAPTCVAEGYTTYTCACGDTYTSNKVPATGHKEETVTGKDATCTEKGLTDGKKCSVCGVTTLAQEVIPAKGHTANENNRCEVCGINLCGDNHTVVTDDAVAATCTTAGKTEGSHCSKCGEVLVAQDVVPAMGHRIENIPKINPTCTKEGHTAYQECVRVGCDYETPSAIIAPLGHNVVTDEAVAPTCENTGLTEGSHCSKCGEVLVAQETIPANGHTANENNRCTICGINLCGENHTVVTDDAVAATCTTAGKTEGKHCSVCNEVLVAQTETPALGHDMGTFAQTSAPSCTEAGEERSDCSRCDYYETKAVDALGHKWNDGAVTTDPTCTTKGVKTFTCQHNSEHTYTEEVAIDEDAHSYDEGVETTPATCTTVGTMTYTCSACGDSYTEDIAINANAHNYDEGVVTTPATCSAKGVKTFTCQHNSAHTYTEEVAIDATAHSYDEGVVTTPTCGAQGYTTHTCSGCGDVKVDTYTNPTGAHTGGTATATTQRQCTVCETRYGQYEVIVYYKNIPGWTTVKCHAWDDKSSFAGTSWPGNATTSEGNDWYSYKITSDEAFVELKVIFNNGNSGTGNQTIDLTYTNGKNYYASGTWYKTMSEANTACANTLFLKPNANWKTDNARFAAYFCNGSSTAKWVDMKDTDGDGIYECAIPKNENHKNVIFCRMKSGTTANNWNNKWNQTGDLVYSSTIGSGKNFCSIKDGQWDCGTNVTWSKKS